MDVKVFVNGKAYLLEDGVSLKDFLRRFCLREYGVAVALNMNIIPSEEFSKTFLVDGDRLDVVRPVAGG